MEWLETPGALSPRTKRPYSPRATERYRVSLNSIFATLPNGRETRTTDLTRGSLLAFRESRRKHVTGSSINRDLSALQALRRWCADQKGLKFADFTMPKERENAARYRWLSREELDAWQKVIPGNWRTFFGMLLNTGMRVGEALGLTWGDVYLSASRITIGGTGRVKTTASHRHVPINSTLAALLAAHAKQVPSQPSDPVFPQPTYRYALARAVLESSRKAAEVRSFRMHDLRHTYAVHAIQANVPIPRLQKQLGHASAVMTLRYAAHDPNAYFAQDAAAIDKALNGATSAQQPEKDGNGGEIAHVAPVSEPVLKRA
jgi:integrase